jgi:hypothetical protein
MIHAVDQLVLECQLDQLREAVIRPLRVTKVTTSYHDVVCADGLVSNDLDGYSQLSVVPCLVNGFMPRVGRRW